MDLDLDNLSTMAEADSGRPSLPPRPSALDVLQKDSGSAEHLSRPKLVSAPTTALSSATIQSRSVTHAESETHRMKESASKGSLTASTFRSKPERNNANSRVGMDFDDAESIISVAPSSSRFDVEGLWEKYSPPKDRTLSGKAKLMLQNRPRLGI